MNLDDPVAALEIGTSRTVLAVGEPLGPNRVRVAAIVDIPSSGVRQSQITDVAQAAMSVSSVLARAERESGYHVFMAALAVSGPLIESRVVENQWKVDAKTRVVTEEDVTRLYNHSISSGGADSADLALLDAREQSYGLDDRDGIDSPVGLTGDVLRLRTILVHGPKARLDDQRAAATHAKLTISDAMFAGSCAATAVLTAASRAAGALVVDLGGGCTSFTAWAGGKLVFAGVLPVGGDHVTNDVRVAFGISLAQAESAKRQASATILAERQNGRVPVSKSLAAVGPDSISMRALDVVVNARMGELFSILREKLDNANLLHRLAGGVFLTGGGARLAHVSELAETVLGLHTRIGEIVPEIEGLEKAEFPAAHATVAGLLLDALASGDGEASFVDSMKKIWKKVTRK